MNPPEEKERELLRKIPRVDVLLERVEAEDLASGLPHELVLEEARRVLDSVRGEILGGCGPCAEAPDLELDALAERVIKSIVEIMSPNLVKVINATGVVLHTNIGRAPLSASALAAVRSVGEGYCNLEYRLEDGVRGSRQDHLERLICSLTGCGGAVVVNNNAGAVLLVLAALAKDREVIVSRGELVEIGDSFRLPDIMNQSGARLVEVGTTNRTGIRDYSNSIGPDTAMIMKVHKSNFRIAGYSGEVPLGDLVALGRQHFIPVVEDLGSGSLVDLGRYGMTGEHTLGQSLSGGADLVTCSGDKLLGGPQAGIIAGSADYVDAVRKHPLARALRVDKMTIAAMEATLLDYLDHRRAGETVPALRMLTEPPESVRKRCRRLKRRLDRLETGDLEYGVIQGTSRAGGGSLPTTDIPTYCVHISHPGLPASELESRLRAAEPPVVARVKDDRVVLDLRTVQDVELPVLAGIIATIS